MSAQTSPEKSLLDLSREITPLLASRSREIETARRLPQDLAHLLAAEGFFSMWIPRALGGQGVPLVQSLQALEILAEADPSVAWCISIGISSTLVLPHLPAETAQQIFERPETIICGVYAPRGRADADGSDHFRVSGQWAFGSGTQNADWILAGCRFFEKGQAMQAQGGQPRTHMVVVPRDEVEFLDTWHTSGMRGTGSTDYRLDDVRVSNQFIAGWTPQALPDEPLYRIPQLTLLAVGFGAIALGIARGALNEFQKLASSKTATGQSQRLDERRDVQGEVARAEVKLRAARSHYYETAESLWEAAEHDRVGLEERSALRLSMLHAVAVGAEVCSVAYQLGGASAIYEDSRLQRLFRDSHVITQHVQVRSDLYSVIGSHLMGKPKTTEVL